MSLESKRSDAFSTVANGCYANSRGNQEAVSDEVVYVVSGEVKPFCIKQSS